VSPAMLARLRGKAAAASVENITPCEGGFLTYEHRDQPADAVISVAVLHHLPDFWKQVALLRSAAMLKPGGRLFLFDVVFSFPPSEYARHIDRWIDAFRAKAGDEFVGDAQTHIRDEYSTFDWVLRGMLEAAGFRIDSSEQRDTLSATYVCTRLD
jgi:putative AdoMet-dependent methyltransferase